MNSMVLSRETKKSKKSSGSDHRQLGTDDEDRVENESLDDGDGDDDDDDDGDVSVEDKSETAGKFETDLWPVL